MVWLCWVAPRRPRNPERSSPAGRIPSHPRGLPGSPAGQRRPARRAASSINDPKGHLDGPATRSSPTATHTHAGGPIIPINIFLVYPGGQAVSSRRRAMVPSLRSAQLGHTMKLLPLSAGRHPHHLARCRRATNGWKKNPHPGLTWTPGLRDTVFGFVRIWIRSAPKWNEPTDIVKGVEGPRCRAEGVRWRVRCGDLSR